MIVGATLYKTTENVHVVFSSLQQYRDLQTGEFFQQVHVSPAERNSGQACLSC